ncbi:HAD hydrolase-like protein [bacterium]|nr:HAD hydrolase-like protein [bacterium]
MKKFDAVIFDIDGVLVNTLRTFFNYHRTHTPAYRNLRYDDLPQIQPRYPSGGILKTGIPDYEYYLTRRVLYPYARELIHNLYKHKIKLFCLSGTSHPDQKGQMIRELFDGKITFEHAPYNVPKEQYLVALLKKYSLDKQRTVFIDDRIDMVRDAVKIGLPVVRRLVRFATPSPMDLAHVPCVHSLREFEQYIIPS